MNWNHPIPTGWRLLAEKVYRYLHGQFNSPWTKLTVLLVLALLATREELTFSFSINGEATEEAMPATHAGLLGSDREWTRRELDQLGYVAKYRDIALEEQRTHGIPASITLAQGLLESGIGRSKLATRNNNHFGLKCFSKKCSKDHCSNHSDDHHKDFFRIFLSPEESYRAHSKLLQKSRYQKLFRLSPTDYKGWAHGLSAAGYATDPRYPEKLIALIENLGLRRYDRSN